MYTITFSAYDFQLCAPQSDVKDAFESRELEASFCRDFSCCGLVLSDLHDLLQHYEECHVRLEEDESSLYDDDSSSFWSPASSVPSSPTLDDDSTDALKKKAAAYLSDLYNSNSTTLSPLTLACPTKEDDVAGNFDSIATPPLTPSTPTAPSSASSASSVVSDEAPLPITANNNTSAAKKTAGKKRTYQQYASSSTPTALDILTQSAAKKLAMAANGELPAPILTDEDFLAQAGALLASANTSKCIYHISVV